MHITSSTAFLYGARDGHSVSSNRNLISKDTNKQGIRDDEVHLSDASARLRDAVEKLFSGVSSERLITLREQIAEGTYVVDADKIAQNFYEEEIENYGR